MNADIWHNIMWSRYKAKVFTELHKQAVAAGDVVQVFQIAATDTDRVTLGSVDKSVHDYPYNLLFDCSYSEVPKPKLMVTLARLTWKSKADVTILAGYERPEYWLQLLILTLRRRPCAVFCDSTAFDNAPNVLKGLAKRLFFSFTAAAFCYGQRSAAYASSYGARMTISRCQAAWLPDSYRAEDIPGLRVGQRPTDGPAFVYIGRLSPEKRIDTLLSAFKQVLRRYPMAVLRIVGKGPIEVELKELCASLSLSDNVVFTGARSGQALMDEYIGATCVVLPSWSEPWGLVVNEALHYGCPVVVSHRCGCVPELVENSSCGQVFTCGDINELAAKMINTVALDADRERVARDCLAKIAPYAPSAAAAQILAGMKIIA